MSEDPMTMGSYGTTKDEITEDINFCLTGYNVPLEAEFETENGITVGGELRRTIDRVFEGDVVA